MSLLGWLAELGGARPRLLIAAAAAATAAAIGLLAASPTTVGVEGFLGGEGEVAAATRALYASFGEEPLVVAVRGPLQRLLIGENIARLAALERCLAGEDPTAAPVCAALAKGRYFRSALGPGLVASATGGRLEAALAAVLAKGQRAAHAAAEAVRRQALARGEGPGGAAQLAKEAEAATLAAYAGEAELVARRFGVFGPPALANPGFLLPLFFRAGGASPQPKPRYAALLPSESLALIALRPRAGLGEAAKARAVALVAKAVREGAFALDGGSYALSGEPAVVAQVGEAVGGELVKLLLGAVLVAALVLGLLFSGRPRLLALWVAGQATVITVAILAAVAGSLSLAGLTVAPALVGLGVDYALQTQAALEGGRGDRARFAAGFGRLLAAAAAAGGAALAVLLASPLALVRSVSLYLIVGLLVAFLLAVATAAALAGRPLTGARPPFAEAWRAAQELIGSLPLVGGRLPAIRRLGLHRPVFLLLLSAAVAAAGFALAGGQRSDTELSQLLPRRLGAVASLATLEREAGFAGQLNLLVEGANLASPSDLAWVVSYQRRVVRSLGATSCRTAPLCPTVSLAGLPARGGPARLRSLFYALPPALREALITPNHRRLLLSFAQRLLPAPAERQLIARVLALAKPPAGVRVRPAGLLAAVAQEGANLASPARRLTGGLLSLAAGFLAILILSRSLGLALLAAAFCAISLGWSLAALVAVGVPLNPLASSLGAVAVAVAYEFAVLMAATFKGLLAAGASPAEALERLYATTGATVFASGAAVLAGFAVLAAAPIPLLSQFGAGTVVELAALQLAVFIALPALLGLLAAARSGSSAFRGGSRSATLVGGR